MTARENNLETMDELLEEIVAAIFEWRLPCPVLLRKRALFMVGLKEKKEWGWSLCLVKSVRDRDVGRREVFDNVNTSRSLDVL